MPDQPVYKPAEIESKWQKKWEQDGLYNADIDVSKPKYYALTMLPYPSGDLHIGHWYAMTPSDARARYKRMRGFNVMFPMGFDAFGLPAENAAIKNNIHPKEWTYANIVRMRDQLRSMGSMYDWRREAVSADPHVGRLLPIRLDPPPPSAGRVECCGGAEGVVPSSRGAFAAHGRWIPRSRRSQGHTGRMPTMCGTTVAGW